MRILVVGAGAVGGYFGARLLAAGRDVTFLVRPGRAARLASDGLVVRSPHGDLSLDSPPTVLAEELRSHFDLVLLSCKAYDLAAAMDSFAPAVGSNTAVLPLLNGMRHLDQLDERFGPGAVLGGLCLISSMVDQRGRIVHLNELHRLTFGARDGFLDSRLREVATILDGAGFDLRLSDTITQEMWEKWVFIATLAGATCLMRASIGDIMGAGGEAFTRTLLQECASIAAANGFPTRSDSYLRSLALVTGNDSTLSASMLHDIERGARTEGEHILGDLLTRGFTPHGARPSNLDLAYMHLRAYEARREREGPLEIGL